MNSMSIVIRLKIIEECLISLVFNHRICLTGWEVYLYLFADPKSIQGYKGVRKRAVIVNPRGSMYVGRYTSINVL